MSGSELWTLRQQDKVLETPVFDVRRDRKERPRSARAPKDFFILEAVDWVNVIPLTEEKEVVLIELHRHGTNDVSMEIPGGMVDPEDASPMEAAAREMAEETGYGSEPLELLGAVHPNPAIQENRCHSFLAPGARLVGDQRPDETEDITVVTRAIADVPQLIASGRITHALVIAGFFYYFQKYGFEKDGVI